MKGGEIRNCIAMIVSYCYDTLEKRLELVTETQNGSSALDATTHMEIE